MSNKIILKADEIETLSKDLKNINEKMNDEISAITSKLSALASNEKALFSEGASANLIHYMEKVESSINKLVKEQSEAASTTLTALTIGIEKVDKV